MIDLIESTSVERGDSPVKRCQRRASLIDPRTESRRDRDSSAPAAETQRSNARSVSLVRYAAPPTRHCAAATVCRVVHAALCRPLCRWSNFRLSVNPLKPSGVISSFRSVPCHPGLTYIFNFWHSGTLALRAERQSARMSEIKNVG